MGQKIRESEVIGANDSGFYLKVNAFMHKWVRVGEIIRYNIENRKRPGLFISFGFIVGPDSFFVIRT